ncbi:winged helix-turn-helix transcriptional regulator [Aureivirga sp. CE67]|uniref:winged helix-turn-helix transcriptional regulator n=1 Tax=Aureivirga sp. CE67 TaxID=1788983 RepID=UPI0018CA408D|nr:helix-turn-helix domain-containing protein [Aureivirga sp. CE67]
MKIKCDSELIKLNGKLYPCSTSVTMDFIGGKWKTVILFHLKDGSKRYNELRKSMPVVTERTLSLQLKQLENDGIVKRKVYTTKPPLKVEYSLTKFGKTLIPVLEAISNWGNQICESEGEIVKVEEKKPQ